MPSGGGLILSQAYGNLFSITVSERYFPFSYCDIYFITPERCEYLNTICEVLVYNFRACFRLKWNDYLLQLLLY